MTSTPDEAVNLEAAVERLEVVGYRYSNSHPDAGWWRLSEEDLALQWPHIRTEPLVRLSDAEAALSASNARAVAAEEALRVREGLPIVAPDTTRLRQDAADFMTHTTTADLSARRMCRVGVDDLAVLLAWVAQFPVCREAADEIERLRTSLKEKTTVPCGECKGTGNRLCRPMWAGDPHPPQDLCPKCLGKGRLLATMGDQTRD